MQVSRKEAARVLEVAQKDLEDRDRLRNPHRPDDIRARLAAKLAAKMAASGKDKIIKDIPTPEHGKKQVSTQKEKEKKDKPTVASTDGMRKKVIISSSGKKTAIVHAGDMGLPETATDDERAEALMGFVQRTVENESNRLGRPINVGFGVAPEATSSPSPSPSPSPSTAPAPSRHKEAVKSAFIEAISSFKQEMQDEANWLRGLCASMGKCIFTLQEALLSVCLAIGKDLSAINVEKECVYSDPEFFKLRLARANVAVGAPHLFPRLDDQQKALGFLRELTAGDYISMEKQSVWRLCSILLKIYPVLDVPCRVAPLALHWINHTASHKECHPRHAEAVVWFAKFLRDRNQPIASAAMADHGLQWCAKTVTSGVMVARLNLYRGWGFMAAGDYGPAMACFREGLRQDPNNQSLPASLLLELYDGATQGAKAMDQIDRQWCYVRLALKVLERENPPYDDTAVEFERIYSVLTVDAAVLLGGMKCFAEALALISKIPLSTYEKLGTERFGVITEMFERFASSARMDHTLTITGCDWRVCQACKRVAKDLLPCPCTIAFYCNETCQLEDWPKHEKACARCWNCGKVGFTFRHCSRCMKVRYCTQDCLSAHWPQHKTFCAPKVVVEVAEGAAVEGAAVEEHAETKPEDVSTEEEEEGPVFSDPICLDDLDRPAVEMKITAPVLEDYEDMVQHAVDQVKTQDGWFDTLVRVLGAEEDDGDHGDGND